MTDKLCYGGKENKMGEGRKKSVQVTKGSRGRGRTAVSKVRDFLTNLNITGVLRARTGARKLAL